MTVTDAQMVVGGSVGTGMFLRRNHVGFELLNEPVIRQTERLVDHSLKAKGSLGHKLTYSQQKLHIVMLVIDETLGTGGEVAEMEGGAPKDDIVEIGHATPDFALTCVDGQEHKLSDFCGLNVMV